MVSHLESMAIHYARYMQELNSFKIWKQLIILQTLFTNDFNNFSCTIFPGYVDIAILSPL